MMPTEGSQNPIEHPNAKEPPTPTTVILARLPLTSFSIRSFPVTPIAMPIIVPHTKLNTAHYRSGLCVKVVFCDYSHQPRQLLMATATCNRVSPSVSTCDMHLVIAPLPNYHDWRCSRIWA